MSCETQNLNQKQKIYGEIVTLFDYKKFDDGKYGKKQTGFALLNNKSHYGVIDIDMNDKAEENRKIVMEILYEKIPKKNLKIVKTGSYGLHYYTKYDSLDDHPDKNHVHQNRYPKIYKSDKFDIDLFIPHDIDSRSLIVLPGSTCDNKYGVRGTYELLKDCEDERNLMTTSEFLKLLNEMGITISLRDYSKTSGSKTPLKTITKPTVKKSKAILDELSLSDDDDDEEFVEEKVQPKTAKQHLDSIKDPKKKKEFIDAKVNAIINFGKTGDDSGLAELGVSSVSRKRVVKAKQLGNMEMFDDTTFESIPSNQISNNSNDITFDDEEDENVEREIEENKNKFSWCLEKPQDAMSPTLFKAITQGFVGLKINRDYQPIEKEITLCPLFTGFYAMKKVGISDVSINNALSYIRSKANLTTNAANDYTNQQVRYMAQPYSHHGEILKMLRIHNPQYYAQKIVPLLPSYKPKLQIDDPFTLYEMELNKRSYVNADKSINYLKIAHDLCRVMLFIPGPPNLWIVKSYDALEDYHFEVIKNEKEIMSLLRGIIIAKDGKKHITPFETYQMNRNQFMKRGLKFYTEDPTLFSFFQGYAFKPSDNVNMEIIQPYLDHIKYVCCTKEDDDGEKIEGEFNEDLYNYLINLISLYFQVPNIVSGVIPVLIGQTQGGGKNTITDVICALMGQFANPNLSDINTITGNFNSALFYKKLMIINEMTDNKNENRQTWDKLKTYATESKVSINEKFKNLKICENVSNFWILTNHGIPVLLEQSNRRYVIFKTNDGKAGDREYFDHLHLTFTEEFYQNLLAFFLTRDLSKFDHRSIPHTYFEEAIKYTSQYEYFIQDYYQQLVKGVPNDRILEFFNNHAERSNYNKITKGTLETNLKLYCTCSKAKPRIWKLRPQYVKKYANDNKNDDNDDDV